MQFEAGSFASASMSADCEAHPEKRRPTAVMAMKILTMLPSNVTILDVEVRGVSPLKKNHVLRTKCSLHVVVKPYALVLGYIANSDVYGLPHVMRIEGVSTDGLTFVLPILCAGYGDSWESIGIPQFQEMPKSGYDPWVHLKYFDPGENR